MIGAMATGGLMLGSFRLDGPNASLKRGTSPNVILPVSCNSGVFGSRFACRYPPRPATD
jgi:hypothetical protein